MRKIRKLLARLGRRARSDESPVIDIDDPALRMVVEAFDETEAASAALARATHWQADRPAVLRHHLVLPVPDVARVESLLREDGWTVRASPRTPPGKEVPEAGGDESSIAVVALRVQLLDALRCSQESARMAGLAQRFRGHALGWDAMQPDPSD